MFRSTTVLLVSLLAAGCGGSAKELPTDVVTPGDRGSPEAPPAVPKTSEPEASKFVQGRIAAATGGKPERLEKLKAFRQKATGRWRWPNADGTVNATREIGAVWPGRVSVKLDYASGQIKETHAVLRDGTAKLANNLGSGFVAFDAPNAADFDAIMAVDIMAEQWLPTLLPLSDPRTIVFDYKKQPAGAQMADTVKVSIPRCPVYTLWFDAGDGLLGLIDYTHAEFDGRPIAKQVLPTVHKPFDGISLPTDMVYRRGGEPVQIWSVTKWEFPDKIEDSAFELKK